MLNKSEEKRNQIQMFCIEDLVPKKYLINGRVIHTIFKFLEQFLKFASFHFSKKLKAGFLNERKPALSTV